MDSSDNDILGAVLKLPEHSGEESPNAVPTAQDHANARIRREIADRQEVAYDEVLAWAQAAFGDGWLPSHRHFLLDRDEEERARYTGGRPKAAAAVYTVRNAERNTRHFTVEDGAVVPHESYEAGFGTMLLEPHPSRGFMHQGVFCRVHRYSLCFAPYERYEPKTAEQLAALRASRERNKAVREQKKWEAEHPLWARIPDVG